MRVKMIDKTTGVDMWVDGSRYEEYLKAGHKPAVEVPEAPKVEPVKKATRKTKK